MSIDAYAQCPCGSGKKIKFCCSKDIIHDLEKVIRAMGGDQRAAALDQINKLIADKGPRLALLVMKAETELELDDSAALAATVAELQKQAPRNPVTLAMQALLAASENVDQAIELLQEALENSDYELSGPIYNALGFIGIRLLEKGRLVAGRGHLGFQAALAGEQDTTALSLIVRVFTSPSVPVVLKDDRGLPPSPEGVAWRGEYEAALKSAGRGMWRVACESLESLNQKVPDQPCVWESIALLRSWLNQEQEAAQAWEKYSQLPGISAEAAVEAEALASTLFGPAPDDMIDIVKLTFQVSEPDRLMELLLSDRRASAIEGDLSSLAEESEPPPKGAFQFYDKTAPEPQEIQSGADLPRLIGEAFVFGRQTDRSARFELVLDRNRHFDSCKSEIISRLGDLLGSLESEVVVEKVARVQSETSARRKFSQGLTPERAQQLLQELRTEAYLRLWTDIPQSRFGGKSPREAVGDPAGRIKVQAAILNMELSSEENDGGQSFDMNELRRELQLPARGETVEASDEDILELPLPRLGRVDFRRLSDVALNHAYNRLALAGYRFALFRCGKEVLARPSLEGRVDDESIRRMLVSISPSSNESLALLLEGQKRSVSRGKSPAPWLLSELQLRFARMEGPEVNRLIQQLTSRHMQEPGVQQALYSILVRFGVLNPDGTMKTGPGAARPAATVEPAKPSAGGLWTPDSPAPAPQRESKLWIPGGD